MRFLTRGCTASNFGKYPWGLNKVICLISATFIAAGSSIPTATVAQNFAAGERFVPAIWVDPDGCEHWVFDDGFEGYMTPHVTRDGRPVCRTGNTCAVLSADQLFATNSYKIGAGRAKNLKKFFASGQARAFIINGHTDSTASDAYNLALSERRADAVAAIAAVSGAQVFEVRGYGERDPKASNRTATGRAKNRRVEIVCVH
jgi:outer membrane protein OmpA-like peptidoglycan-associated protein